MERRPAALVSVPLARLAGYALLAAVGSLQWVRYVEGASSARAIAWAAAGTATGALVIAARGRPLALGAAALIGAALAAAASGLDLTYLEPKHLDELGDGLVRGAEALNTVRLPYLGKEPWVLTTVQLSGAGICWIAALLATWPTSSRTRIGALVLLLTLAASPVISLGNARPALLGVALAGLTAAFLWLERLGRRPGIGAVALAALVAVTAIPLGAAADREEPWFDYKAFSAKLSGGVPVTYSWDHDYGPIDWTREGMELFRVDSERPYYWKAEVLNTFEDDRWTNAVRFDLGEDPRDDMPQGRRHRDWDTTFTVALRRLRTATVVGAGTVLAVQDATQPVRHGLTPGLWEASDENLDKGDSYRVRAHVPRPSQAQLAAATVGRDPSRAPSLRLGLAIRPEAAGSTPSIPQAQTGVELHPDEVSVVFDDYDSGQPPRAEYRQLGLTGSGFKALRATYYWRTWQLAARLRRQSDTPYDYLLRVNGLLRSDDFAYTEVPSRPDPGVAPLESFLFDSKRGYCQHFAGAMALLLRMGGIPARVVTGFSPGGQRASTGEWVVRDTDAHSWVEAWFDGIGWATFDPTPPATPARSQISAINPPEPGDETAVGGGSPLEQNPRQGDGTSGTSGLPQPAGGAGGGAGTPWPWLGAGALLAAALTGAALLAARRRAALSRPEAALAELERALRRSGRAAPAGTTLTELDRRLGTAATGYLQALRASRYGPGAGAPSPEQRAAFRRELAVGLGWGGRVRAYYALPPTLPSFTKGTDPFVKRGPR